MDSDALFSAALQRMQENFREESGCHDLDHTLRVLDNAERIAEAELPENDAYNRRVIRFAALLHDCARPEETLSGGKICHAAEGRRKSANILRELGCTDETFVHDVSECVGRHRYRGEDHPVSPAEKIVYDADKLDSLGAVGIGRAFMFAARCGARLHNTAAEALEGAPFGREDTAWREYLVKLKDVPDRMLTATGKDLAMQRKDLMEIFFREINREVYGENDDDSHCGR